MPEPQAIINGNLYDYGAVDIKVGGITYVGAVSVDYSSELVPGKVFGSDPGVVGRTPGKATFAAEIEMIYRYWLELREALGDSYGRATFDVVVSYGDDGQGMRTEEKQPVTTDSIVGCRITKVSRAHKSGSDALVVRLTLDPTNIQEGLGAGSGGQSIEAAIVEPPPGVLADGSFGPVAI